MELSRAVKGLDGIFTIDELVSPRLCTMYSKDVLWSLFDPELLNSLALIRYCYGEPIWINGRGRMYSGFREPDTAIGARLSAHRQGQALDLHCTGIEELQELIRCKGDIFGLAEMEDPTYTPTWCHISTRKRLDGKFKIIKP